MGNDRPGPYVAPPDDALVAEIEAAEGKIIDALHGVDASAKAQACLMVAIAIWQLGGATADQAKVVAGKAIDAVMTNRSH